jgi:hypothetical protein
VFAVLLLSLAAAVTVAAVGVVAMSNKQGTVYPFAPAKPTIADTLTSDAETVFVDDGWSVATLTRLCDVEDLLDCLEAQNFAQREVRVLGNDCFRVRWK